MSTKLKKIGFYTIVIYTLFGFFLLPYILKSQFVNILEQQLDAKVSIQSVSFNPYIFKLKIDGIQLKSLKDEKLFSLSSLVVDVEPHSLYKGALHLKTLRLFQPDISLVLFADKSFNIASIIKKSDKPKELEKEENAQSSFPRVLLDRIEVLDGSLAYKDYTNPTPFDFSFHTIGFFLEDIDTKDLNTSEASIRFYSSLEDGGFIDFKSDILSLAPLKLEGSLDFEASKLYTQWRYIQDILRLEVANGKLSFHAKYALDLDALEKTRIDDLQVYLDSLRIKPKDEPQNVLTLEKFYIQNGMIEPFAQNGVIETIGLSGLDLKVRRDRQGLIDWLEYIKVDLPKKVEANRSKEPEQTKEAAIPWDVVIKETSLEKIKVTFYDKGVAPQVDSSINDLSLYAKNITLAGVEPLAYKLSLQMNEKFRCTAQGEIIHSALDVATSLECKEFDIVHYRPYIDTIAGDMLKVYDLELASAWLDFDADLKLYKQDQEMVVDVNNSNTKLSKFLLRKKSTQEKLLGFEYLSVIDLAANTKSKELVIEKTELASLDVRIRRLKNKSLNLENLLVFKETQKRQSKQKSKEEKPYRIQLKHFALQGARARFDDQALSTQAHLELDRIDLNAYNIDSKEKSWLNYDLALRSNKSGTLFTQGKLRHSPLKQSSKLQLKKIGLKAFAPYIQEQSYIHLDDGSISMKSDIYYEASKSKPDLLVKGSFALNDFFLSDARNGSLLFSVIGLDLDSFTYEYAPDRFYVNEMGIDSFYLNAIIDEQKNFNLSSLMKQEKSSEPSKEPKDPFPATIAKITVANGSANFADLSLPIKFATNIHDLGGAIYSISSTKEEASIVDITGEVDKYGVTSLKGSVDSADPKRYTDLKFVFKNLALSSMSGYSASFAGYKIDQGKLNLDLSYNIVNSQLDSSNSVIIDKIELGDTIEDENITKLPLGFVIALLEDKDGIIDINMPIQGDVDKPDFKYGGLVVKTLTNLVIKAVSSPFEFLGSMMGIDGESLEYAEFEAGSVAILPPQREKFDSIAKMLIKRPKIALGIFGNYDKKLDTTALRYQKLVDLVVLKSGLTNRVEHRSALNIDLLEDIYEELGGEESKLEKIEEELDAKYDTKAYKVEYLKALVNECSSLQAVAQEELELLAKRRMEAIRDYFLREKQIDPSRINLGEISEIHMTDTDSIHNKLGIEVK
ncbi:MAG: DUF748 domain-containing protein [Sulfurimonas sp.]|jgi:uncharacterized protein involved in outer membrane biogenesis|nr:DUF748 domain-containing protein [Sulfurimonas sp.]